MIVLHRFKVQGVGSFPIDMLRYDSCFPYSEEDAGKITLTTQHKYLEKPIIELGAYHQKGWEPTIGRWDSFLWQVIDWDI